MGKKRLAGNPAWAGPHAGDGGRVPESGRPAPARAGAMMAAMAVCLATWVGPAIGQTFQPQAVVPVTAGPGAIAAGDFDGDGKDDLAMTIGQPLVRILTSSGTGFVDPADYSVPKLSASSSDVLPQYLATGDFDDDQKTDVAYAGRYGSGGVTYWDVGVLFNRSYGFGAGNPHGTGDTVAGMVSADFNRDGLPDLALAARPSQQSSSGMVTVHLTQPRGAMTRSNYYPGDATYSICAGDFDGDHVLDIACGNAAYYHSGEPLGLLYGKGDGYFEDPIRMAGSSSALSAGDVDGDGRDDIAMSARISGAEMLSILYSNSDRTFNRVDYPVTYRPGQILIDDFNKDGLADIAIRDSGTPTLTLLLGEGNRTFAAPEDYALMSNYGDMISGDFNGDGWMDLAVGNQSNGSLSVLYNSLPEPATLSLLALGGLVVFKRR